MPSDGPQIEIVIENQTSFVFALGDQDQVVVENGAWVGTWMPLDRWTRFGAHSALRLRLRATADDLREAPLSCTFGMGTIPPMPGAAFYVDCGVTNGQAWGSIKVIPELRIDQATSSPVFIRRIAATAMPSFYAQRTWWIPLRIFYPLPAP